MDETKSISKLVELSRTIKMSDEDREEQRCSFVFGNVALEDETRTITREMVEARAKALKKEKSSV